MPINARIPEIDLSDRPLMSFADDLGKLADRRCGDTDSFEERSRAAMQVVAKAMWIDEQRRLDAERTTLEDIEVTDEPYHRLNPPSTAIDHGFWGAHIVEEPLYRRTGVHNGPTLKPLEVKLGIVARTMLPQLARAAGRLMAATNSRDTEGILQQLGFHPPSRAVLENRVGGMFEGMAIRARELDEQCRENEELDFEVKAISCGLDRFSVRMQETLPEGSKRDKKLKARRPASVYERTPAEPFVMNWRMAWAGNVTLYDAEGCARRTFRYGSSASSDVTALTARMVDDVLAVVTKAGVVTVSCIQDGASDLEVLRREIDDRLPRGVNRRDLVDFYHAIGYLDAIVAARDDGDPHAMAGWCRGKLLDVEHGATHIVAPLRREHERAIQGSDLLSDAIHAARTYFERRQSQMAYAVARAVNDPVSSGATESTCALFQLRVKHPGSHWGTRGLQGVMNSRALALSGRWGAAFDFYADTLKQDVCAA